MLYTCANPEDTPPVVKPVRLSTGLGAQRKLSILLGRAEGAIAQENLVRFDCRKNLGYPVREPVIVIDNSPSKPAVKMLEFECCPVTSFTA